jgi:hypothetical protein
MEGTIAAAVTTVTRRRSPEHCFPVVTSPFDYLDDGSIKRKLREGKVNPQYTTPAHLKFYALNLHVTMDEFIGLKGVCHEKFRRLQVLRYSADPQVMKSRCHELFSFWDTELGFYYEGDWDFPPKAVLGASYAPTSRIEGVEVGRGHLCGIRRRGITQTIALRICAWPGCTVTSRHIQPSHIRETVSRKFPSFEPPKFPPARREGTWHSLSPPEFHAGAANPGLCVAYSSLGSTLELFERDAGGGGRGKSLSCLKSQFF